MYGFVTKQRVLVTENWQEVKALIAVYPYASFKRFRTEQEAWDFVNTRTRARKSTTSIIHNYGETYLDLCVELNYYITPTAIYANVFLNDKTDLAIYCNEPNVAVTKKGRVILICNKQYTLKPDSLRDTAVAIHSLLRTLGPVVDVNINVPDMATFYMLQYDGRKVVEYVRLQNLIKSRTGKVGITVEHPQYITMEEE